MDNGSELIYNDWSFFKEIANKLNQATVIISLITFSNMQITRLEGYIKDYFMFFPDAPGIRLLSICELLRMVIGDDDNLVYVSIAIKDGKKELIWGQKFINLGVMIHYDE